MFRRRARPMHMLLLHMLSHCCFASAFMSLARADFNGLCLKCQPNLGSFAACLASWSARSFPSMFACPGIHVILIWSCGFSSIAWSVVSRNSLMMACPDCFHGLWVPWMAAWLSAKMCQTVCSLLSCIVSTARFIAVSSAAYTLNLFLLPRYCAFLFSV